MEPQDVLALGRQLVEELQLEPSVDTLGRWMAHHLAELMTDAENGEDPAARSVATRQAVETILRVWSHRATYHKINPLADLMPVLSVLRTLAEEAPPWGYIPDSSGGDAARRVYDLLRRYVISVSMLELGGIEAADQALARAKRTDAWQSAEERQVVQHLLLWVGASHREAESRKGRSRRTVQEAASNKPPLSLIEVVQQIGNEIEATLADLHNNLPRERI